MYDDDFLMDDIYPQNDYSADLLSDKQLNALTEQIQAAKDALNEVLPNEYIACITQHIEYGALKGEAPYYMIAYDNQSQFHSINTYPDIASLTDGLQSTGASLHEQQDLNIKVIIDNEHSSLENLDLQTQMIELKQQFDAIEGLPFEVVNVNHPYIDFNPEQYNGFTYPNNPGSYIPVEQQELPAAAKDLIDNVEGLLAQNQVDVKTLAEYLSVYYAVHQHEELGIILAKDNQVVSFEVVHTGTHNAVSSITGEQKDIWAEKFKEAAEKHGVNQVIEFHNHPYAETTPPSLGDVRCHISWQDYFENNPDILDGIQFDSLIVSPYNEPCFFSQHSDLISTLEDSAS